MDDDYSWLLDPGALGGGNDDYSWLLDGLGGGNTGGGLDDATLLPLIPQDPSSLYDPMTPFQPNDPSYGTWAINWDGSIAPAAQFAAQLLQGSGKGGGTSGGSSGGGTGGLNLGSLAPLLSLLGLAGGGLYAYNQSGRAADAATSAIHSAMDDVNNVFSQQAGLFKPYTDLGAAASSGLMALPAGNIAANFRPLGAGRGIVGGAGAPTMTLGQLAGTVRGR